MPSSLQIPPYRAALLTNADGSPVIRANGPDSEPVMTERQWYMFWQNLAGQLNANTQTLEGLGNIATYGNHADRPDPEFWPNGALYVEWDRGSVIYQNQGGIWVYIAGQMFGTLSPDQRPTDLGPAADVGFLFRTTTDPARSFAWSGTAWIETTPIRYGTHAERLAETITDLVSGMLWMETDRGSVIYQNQGGTWLYLAGTMWDTLVPDQRPTDLGVFDAGFDFRTTDPPPREFIWNQTAWVEVTNIGGATGLTHPNVVAKVGATPGQLVEGGITDESAGNSDRLHITAAGAVGVGTIPSAGSGLAVKGGDIDLAEQVDGRCIGFSTNEPGGKFVDAASGVNCSRYGYTYLGAARAFSCALSAYGGLHLYSADIERVNIDGSGRVGIGIAPSYTLQLVNDSAGKPATSSWSVVSDIRLKQNIEPVKDDSLAILDKLDWVRYEYNGQAQMPQGLKAIGLVAQALREQLPEAVRSTKGKLRETDDDETDVLAIDYHYVLVHSARAIQQLSAEVKRLAALIEKPA